MVQYGLLIAPYVFMSLRLRYVVIGRSPICEGFLKLFVLLGRQGRSQDLAFHAVELGQNFFRLRPAHENESADELMGIVSPNDLMKSSLMPWSEREPASASAPTPIARLIQSRQTDAGTAVRPRPPISCRKGK